MITQDEIEAAIARLSRTPDGALLYLYLQRRMMAKPGSDDPTESALRVDFAQRRFASELMGLMTKDFQSDGPSEPNFPGGERPIVFARQQPVALARPRGLRRAEFADAAERPKRGPR